MTSSPTPNTKAPEGAEAENGHIWHERVFSSMQIKCCMNCGFIKNEQQPNKPCPGPVFVGLRSDNPHSSAKPAALDTAAVVPSLDAVTDETSRNTGLVANSPETATMQRVNGHSQHEGVNAQATVQNEVVTVVGTESGTVANSDRLKVESRDQHRAAVSWSPALINASDPTRNGNTSEGEIGNV